MTKPFSKGIITTYALVFGAIFLIMLAGLLGFVLLQLKQASQKVAWNEALHIAEAGVDYYRWCLNNEVEEQCQTEKEYTDPVGNPIGKFSLEVTSTASCQETVSKTIVSTGWTYDFPDIKREVSVLYARTSVAQYAYLLNDNVWAGADREIRGLYHSNGGIRMDGENQSLVTSAKEDWVCTCSFGCRSLESSQCQLKSCSDPCAWDGSNCTCPGVFTTTGNSNPDLFDFPVPPFDFDGITVDLAQMKSLTQGGQGLYFGPSGQEGYHIMFEEDGSIDIWEVNSVQMLDDVCTTVGAKVICDDGPCEPECPQCESGKCVVEDPVIESESFIDNYLIPGDCSVVFFEDDLWVGREDLEGKIKGKVTVVSADLIDPGKETDVWLQGDITYSVGDGSDGLAILAQHNNLIGLYSPDAMELKGIFLAQTGHFGRNHYPCSKYSPHCVRSKLEITGSIVSNGRVGTRWSGGISGYLKRENYFDPNLVYSPSPFVPYASPEFKILDWEEIE